MQDRTKPTAAQIDYCQSLMWKLGYDETDVRDMTGADFADLTRSQMARLIDELKDEWEGGT